MSLNLTKKFNTAIKAPPDILAQEILNMGRLKFGKQFSKVFPMAVSDKQICKVMNYQNDDETPMFLFDFGTKDRIVKTIKQNYSGSIKSTIYEADKILKHDFDILGSGRTNLGPEIDWHTDFESGHTWDAEESYLGTGRYITFDNSSDVKIPWELSRCQHFVTLGKSYWHTNDEEYAKEFIHQIDGWINQNLIGKGINWTCMMEVSIRAINWILSYEFFKESAELSLDFRKKFLNNLYLHGKFLKKYLWMDARGKGNHYISDLVGLIYLGLFFEGSKETKRWLDAGVKGLFKEIDNQIHSDGTHYEGSLGYHRLVSEILISTSVFLKNNSLTIPEKYTNKLEKMIEFVMYYTKPDASVPMIGDADDGRLFKFSEMDINDHQYLINAGAVLFNRPDFKSAYPDFSEESYWILGSNSEEMFHDIKPFHEFNIKSKGFPDAGFYIMRQDDCYMFINGGHQKKPLKVGHLHNDTLSFELHAKDKSFIIDPGTYCYTSEPKWRNRFRGTAYHNTVVVDGKEQNEIDEDRIFGFKEFDAIAKLNKWESNENYDLFDGEHCGYHRLEHPVTHRRKIFFDKKERCWEITDILMGEGKHMFEWFFHFAPMKLEQDKKNPLIIRTKCKGTNIELIPEVVPQGMKCEIRDGWISKSYGKKEKAAVVRYWITENVSLKSKIRISAR